MTASEVEWTVSRVVARLQTSDRFRLPERQFNLQYAHLYHQRKTELSKSIKVAAKARWPTATHVPKVLDVQANELCFVIGTIYADLPLKPNVLDEITAERYLVPPPPRPKYVSDKDQFVLEDESGRITLVGDRLAQELLPTGLVTAVLGMQQTGGEFTVHDFCYAGMAPQAPLSDKPAEEAYVLLLSGLNVGSPTSNPLARQLLVDWLTGQVGSPEDQARAAKIVHAIVAGNSLTVEQAAAGASASAAANGAAAMDEDRSAVVPGVGPSTNGGGGGGGGAAPVAKRHTNDSVHFLAEPLLQLDQVLSELCESISLDMMPGERDPANFTLPQQPMYRSLFPYAATMSTFRMSTNPHAVDVNGVHFLGSSGQPLDDLYKYLPTENRLQILEQTLHWRHMAPTAPDTLGSFPFENRDPFIIENTPHVYFVGNQPEFGTRLVRHPDGQIVRLVLVPSFASTSTAVLVDLRTLDVHSLIIRATLSM